MQNWKLLSKSHVSTDPLSLGIPEKQDPGPWNDSGPRRTQDPMRTKDPVRTQDLMRTRDTKRTKDPRRTLTAELIRACRYPNKAKIHNLHSMVSNYITWFLYSIFLSLMSTVQYLRLLRVRPLFSVVLPLLSIVYCLILLI